MLLRGEQDVVTTRLGRKVMLSVLLFGGVAAGLVAATPPGLPVLDLDASLRGQSKPVFVELKRDHYGSTAAGFSERDCSDGFTPSSSATRYDGWHFVLPSSSGSAAFRELQVVFTDLQGDNPVTYRIRDDGTSVTANPGPGGFLYFRNGGKHVDVLTPNPGTMKIAPLTPALQLASPPAPYKLAIYGRTSDGTDHTSVGSFNLSHTCSNGPIKPPGDVPCQYATDASVLTASGGRGTLSGTLTCRGNALPAQTVLATSGATRATTTTGAGGAYTFTSLPAGSYEVSFPGSATVPAASTVRATVSG